MYFFKQIWGEYIMITCDVCGHLNDPSNVVCEECGSDLSDSPDWNDNYYD